ncbi:MAG TPA: hypothetical protein VMM27_05055 [Casimicrobiaceae bacterium]|nr:hypothetical protein [Casimicrobiaceae bacterium]
MTFPPAAAREIAAGFDLKALPLQFYARPLPWVSAPADAGGLDAGRYSRLLGLTASE